MNVHSKIADAAGAPRESRADKILRRRDHIEKIAPHLAVFWTSKSIVRQQNEEHQRLTELKEQQGIRSVLLSMGIMKSNHLEALIELKQFYVTNRGLEEHYQKKNADLEAREAAVKVAEEENRKQKEKNFDDWLANQRESLEGDVEAKKDLDERSQLIGSTIQMLRRQEEHNAQRMEKLFTQEDEVQAREDAVQARGDAIQQDSTVTKLKHKKNLLEREKAALVKEEEQRKKKALHRKTELKERHRKRAILAAEEQENSSQCNKRSTRKPRKQR